jgi:hypothetical protein
MATWLRDLLSLRSRLSLADFEAPDDLLVEAVQAPAQTAVWSSEISTRAQPAVSSAPALPAQDISPLIKASFAAWNLLPGAPAHPTTSSADPSSAPDTATATAATLKA